MNNIEKLMSQYPDVKFEFEQMPYGMSGLNIGNKITINSELNIQEQYQWLCEEIGHYETSIGDISNYQNRNSYKQEQKARIWGMKKRVPKETLIKIVSEPHDDDYEIAEEIGVQIDYLHSVAMIYGYNYK